MKPRNGIVEPILLASADCSSQIVTKKHIYLLLLIEYKILISMAFGQKLGLFAGIMRISCLSWDWTEGSIMHMVKRKTIQDKPLASSIFVDFQIVE